MQRVKDVITRGIEHVAGTATVQQAAELMAEKDIGLLAVSNGESANGVITDRDIVVRCLASGKDPGTTAVQQCMTTGIAAVSEDADVAEAGQIMKQRQIRRLMVTDANGMLTGVASLGGLATGCTDDHLRAEVLEQVSTG
ncbi:MAG: CBS domain-containing protein [Maioricimonas sp. JB049]